MTFNDGHINFSAKHYDYIIKRVKQLSLITFILFFALSCRHHEKSPDQRANNLSLMEKRALVLHSAHVVQAYIAKTPQEQEIGLSGTKSLEDNEGMLFSYPSMTPLRFWMPNTFLDLDIFFMNENLEVIHIERGVPAHPGHSEPPKIYRTATIRSQYVLELKAGTSIGKRIQLGHKLKWASQ